MKRASSVPPYVPFEVTALLAVLDRGMPLETVLAALIREVEQRSEGMIGSILLLEGTRLRHGAAPGLPAAYSEVIDGIEIGPSVGSCGTAAYCGHAIFVSDITTDPLWKDFAAVAQQYGLRACWSSPIVEREEGGDGRVLGTFALYYRTVRSPTTEERAAIQRAADAALAILRRARERAVGVAGERPSAGEETSLGIASP